MALPKIGLEAVLAMGNFNKGMKQYTKGVAGMEKETKTAAGSFSMLDDKLGGLGGGLTSLIPGVVGATGAFLALSEVMEFGREGATVAQTQESFDRLMDSMDIAPGTLQRMRDATLGTVDDMTLMSSTLTLVAGTSDELGTAMVEASPKLLEIAKAANKLNPSLGDTAFLYESLSRGIKRSSPLILDNLGLVIKIGEANQQWADANGVAVESMTAEQKSMALLEAALESGDRMLEQVGGSTVAAGDDFAYAETQMTNLTNQLKVDMLPTIASLVAALTPLIGLLGDLLELIEKLPGGVSFLLGGVTNLNQIWQENKKAAKAAKEETEALADAEKDLTTQTEELSDEQHDAEITTEGLEKAQKELTKAIEAVGKAYEQTFSELSGGILDLRELGKAAADSAKDYNKAMSDLDKSTAKSLGDVKDNFEASLPDRTTVAERLGMAEDAWDEWGLRLQAIIEGGIADPWYATLQEMGYSKPPDVGVKEWAQDLQDEFYAGRLPDLLPPEWAEKVRQQQQEATAAVRQGAADRRAELEKARQEELAAEQAARDEATLKLALSVAEQTGLLEAWSQQRFGPDMSVVADEADEVFGLLESGMLDLDSGLQGIIADMLAGIQGTLQTTGEKAEETQEVLGGILDTDWYDQRRGTMTMIGQVIDDELSDATPMETMLANFEGAEQGILDSAINMGLGLGTEFDNIDKDWAATVQSQVRSWDDGMTKVRDAIQKKVIEKLEEIPKKITITVTTEQEGGEGKQHGGPVPGGVPVMVGEGGPELFVPDTPGTVIPNWRMNVPSLLSQSTGGTTTAGAPIQITINPVINSGMDLAEFEARTLQTVQRAIRGA